jgi:hypothetical protein
MPRRFTSSLAVIGSLVLALLLVCGAKANADILFESAQIGELGANGGADISAWQFLGVRFTTTQDETVTGLGIHAGVSRASKIGNGMIFLAITPLSSPGGFPKTLTLDDAILDGLLSPPFPSADVSLPTDFLLPAGDYALVAGAGSFGATGDAFAPQDNEDIGTPRYFFYSAQNGLFVDGGIRDIRFFVEGHPVTPEPSSTALLATGMFPLLGFLSRRKLLAARP